MAGKAEHGSPARESAKAEFLRAGQGLASSVLDQAQRRGQEREPDGGMVAPAGAEVD
jgi:hypothetical protein